MLLRSLYQYSNDEKRRLYDRLPFQVRTVHRVIDLLEDGTPRGNKFDLRTRPQTKLQGGVEETVQKPGQRVVLPRFPGEKNNTRAQYLADPLRVVLGLSGETLQPVDTSAAKPSQLAQQIHHVLEVGDGCFRAVLPRGQTRGRIETTRRARDERSDHLSPPGAD